MQIFSHLESSDSTPNSTGWFTATKYTFIIMKAGGEKRAGLDLAGFLLFHHLLTGLWKLVIITILQAGWLQPRCFPPILTHSYSWELHIDPRSEMGELTVPPDWAPNLTTGPQNLISLLNIGSPLLCTVILTARYYNIQDLLSNCFESFSFC